MAKLYYTPPSQEAFDEMKVAATKVWKGYDDEYGYATQKIQRIATIQNVQDNFMYMFAMFDHINQAAVVLYLSDATKQALRERLIDGGNDRFYLLMLGL